MKRSARSDPLAGTERLIVDGSNLLHALGRGGHGPAPAATLIGRLRAAVPPVVRIELVFDGPPDRGMRGTRIASGLTVRHSAWSSADRVIDRLVADAIGSGGTPEAAYTAGSAILVVSDDLELGQAIRRRGGRTVGTAWLIRRLERERLSARGTERTLRVARTIADLAYADEVGGEHVAEAARFRIAAGISGGGPFA